MQSLARELNVAETVFVLPPEQGGDIRIRIFTPASELPFAGHPVLGASFVVGGALGLDEVRLETGLGVVPLRLERSGGRVVFGWMEQPVAPWQPYERADGCSPRSASSARSSRSRCTRTGRGTSSSGSRARRRWRR